MDSYGHPSLSFFREFFYLVFTVVVPPVSYIFMGQMFGNNTYSQGFSYAQQYTPSFIILISFSVVFFAFGFDQVMNRASGIEKRLFITPITDKILLLSGIMKSFMIVSAGFFFITIIGVFVYKSNITVTSFLLSYISFLVINAILLIFSQAVYTNFREVKTALTVSIVMFQVVMFTGGFSIPVENMPASIQVIAKINPIYHLNQIYISIWNQTFVLNGDMVKSIIYLLVLLFISFFVIKSKKKK